MSLTNFPNGVASYGVPVLPQRYYRRTIWVGNTSSAGLLTHPEGIGPTQPMSSVFGASGALALAASTSQNQGTLIRVLDGHVESVSAADIASHTSTQTNITIQGEGGIATRATFNWTAAGGTWLFDTAGIWLHNLNLHMAGALAATDALTVAAPITVSAAGCAIRGCYVNMGVDADQIVTNGITTTAAGDYLTLEDNLIVGATAAECTSMIKLVGCDGLVMKRNHIAGATGAAGAGVVLFATTASLNITMEENFIANRKASSQGAVTGLAGVSGVSRKDLYHYLDDTSTTAWLTSTGIMAFYNSRTVNLAGEHGMLSTVVST